jgi:hypothetical protein
MANDNEPIGIMHSHIDGTLSIIDADGWPYSPDEYADMLRETSDGRSLELLQRFSDAIREWAGPSHGAN